MARILENAPLLFFRIFSSCKSRNYILNLLEAEFEVDYNRLLQSGLLQHEVINIVNHSLSVFNDLNFSDETEDDRFTQYAIIGMIGEYLESSSEKENVNNELQQSTETSG